MKLVGNFTELVTAIFRQTKDKNKTKCIMPANYGDISNTIDTCLK